MFATHIPPRRIGRLLRSGFAALALCTFTPSTSFAADAPAADFKPMTEKVPGTDVAFDMLPIPGGTLKMGSPDGEPKRKADEGPQFEVKIEPFYMAKYTVTWPEYTQFLSNYQRLAEKSQPAIPPEKMGDAVTYPTPMYELEAGAILERMGRGPGFPAVIMSQFAARQYTKWLSKKTGHFYRLPTEAEWEYACRAGATTPYTFGEDDAKHDKLKENAWFFDNSALADGDGAYHKVGLKKPNAWGLYDMHGNVAEWVLDGYSADWYKQFAGKTVDWKEAINWSKEQYPRVIRGGGWNSEAEDCRSAARYASNKKLNLKDPQGPQSPYWLTEGFWIGFRVVSPVKEPTEAEKLKYWNADDDDTKDSSNRDRDYHELIVPPAK